MYIQKILWINALPDSFRNGSAFWWIYLKEKKTLVTKK